MQSRGGTCLLCFGALRLEIVFLMKTQITAHTGSDGYQDNSLEFVRYALSTDADVLEVDIRRGVHGELVISHDDPTEDAPLFSEVLALVAAHPTMKINCDLKPAGLELEVCRMAAEAGLSGRMIFSGTVDASLADAVRDTAEIYLNIEEYVRDIYLNYREIPDFELQAAEIMVDVCKRYNIGVVNMYQGLVTRRMIETFAAQGIGISAWTINEERELRWFLTRGVMGITTRSVKKTLELQQEIQKDN